MAVAKWANVSLGVVLYLMLTQNVYSDSGFFSKYSTIRADIVGIRDSTSGEKLWYCTEDSADYCDLSRANKGNLAQLTGTSSNFSYDGDGVNSGEQGTVYVEISQPSIYNPLKLEGVSTFKRGGQWLERFSDLINQGRLTVDLTAGEEKVDAKLWFLHMNIRVNLGSLGNNDWFSSGIYKEGYGETVVLIRLMPQVIKSVYIKELSESGFNDQIHNFDNLFFGPHMVEAARVRTDGRFGPNRNGTSGVKWNSGSDAKLSYNPADTWGFPLTDKELKIINQVSSGSSEESIGLSARPELKKSWFNRPVYFAIPFDHLKVGKDKREIDGKLKTVWVSPSAQIDAVIHTYIIGNWVNKPIDKVETKDTPVEIVEDKSFFTQLKRGFGLFDEIGNIYTYLKWLALFIITSIAFLILNWVRVKLKTN